MQRAEDLCFDGATAPGAIALFNPGLGHPHLRAGWTDTIEIIRRARVPVLLTAFSDADQRADLAHLARILGAPIPFRVQPHLNAFRSRRLDPDPHNPTVRVQANYAACVIAPEEPWAL